MFGTKVSRLQTRNRYTIEELFDAIKEARFTAGKPRLTHQGFSQFIVFPALDFDNQVRVYNAAIVSPSNKFFVQRDEQVGSILDDESADSLLGGWDSRGWNSPHGNAVSNAELCEQLAETTCRELGEMGL